MIAPFQNELVSITGQFNYDTATGGVGNFGVILTTQLEFSGTYTEAGFVAIVPGLGQPKMVFGGTGDNGIFYAIDLFLNGPDPRKLGDEVYDISFVDAGGSAAGGPNYTLLPADAMHRPTITALVGSEAPVPEPATWMFALTGGALVLLRLLPRARAKIQAARLSLNLRRLS
jgi:hypothetical protein